MALAEAWARPSPSSATKATMRNVPVPGPEEAVVGADGERDRAGERGRVRGGGRVREPRRRPRRRSPTNSAAKREQREHDGPERGGRDVASTSAAPREGADEAKREGEARAPAVDEPAAREAGERGE